MIEAIGLLKLEIARIEKIAIELREAKLFDRVAYRTKEAQRLQRVVDLLERELKFKTTAIAVLGLKP